MAIISSTMGNHSSRLCVGDSSRPGDIGCPSYAPSLTTAGDLTVSGNVSASGLTGNTASIGALGVGSINASGDITATGRTVTAGFFVGNGAGLTNIAAASADRIVSGTTSMLAISNTGYISITQAGTNTGWFDPALGLVTIGVSSTGPISGSGLFINGNSTLSGTVTTGNINAANFTLNTSGINFYQSGAWNGTTISSFGAALYRLGGAKTGGSGYVVTLRSGDAGGNSSANQNIGGLAFQSDYAFQAKNAAQITAMVDGTAGTSAMPGRLMFYTTPSGSITPTERVRIDSNGTVGIGITPTMTSGLEVSGTVSATRFVGNGSGLTGVLAGSTDRIVSGSVNIIAEQTSGTVRVSGTLAMVNSGNEVCGPATYNSIRINPVTHFMELCRP